MGLGSELVGPDIDVCVRSIDRRHGGNIEGGRLLVRCESVSRLRTALLKANVVAHKIIFFLLVITFVIGFFLYFFIFLRCFVFVGGCNARSL